LRAEESSMQGKFVRMGGMVVKGSLHKDLQNLTYRFELTDGNGTFPVYFKGVPPDLFTGGKRRGCRRTDRQRRRLSCHHHHGQTRGRVQPPQRTHPASNSFIPAKETVSR
jgi:hypothetical protein